MGGNAPHTPRPAAGTSTSPERLHSPVGAFVVSGCEFSSSFVGWVSEYGGLGRWVVVGGVSEAAARDRGDELLALYDSCAAEVYGYLLPRCPGAAVAEDLTAETFLAAVVAVKRGTVDRLTVAWLIGVARHKLVDHWRRQAREERKLRVVEEETVTEVDPWDAHLEAGAAHETLARLGAHHRAALSLRYLDGLSVPEVAELLGRTVHATETLLVRARLAFRRAYEGRADG